MNLDNYKPVICNEPGILEDNHSLDRSINFFFVLAFISFSIFWSLI